MTTSLKQNSVYLKLKDGFKKDYFEESISCYQGFVLGMLAQGFTSSHREILSYTLDLFHASQPLPGEGIAVFTTLLIEMENQLKANNVMLFVPTAQDREPKQTKKDFNAIRLKSLSALAYGISLAYNFTPEGQVKEADLSSDDKEELEIITNIVQVDPSSKIDEADIQYVLDYILKSLYRRAKLHKTKA